MGTKSSRNISDSGESLDKQTIDELCEDTGFTEEELLNWHTNFYKDCPDGKLTLKQFEHVYSKIMGKPTQKTSDYVKHMFNVYDQDKNQFIDFREFVIALSAASVMNRLRLVETLFSVFDLDGDGKISKEEMNKMLHTLADVTTSNRKRLRRRHHSNEQVETKKVNLQKRLDNAFNELNTNDDDFITKDEFIDWYIKSGLISDVNSNELNVQSASRVHRLDRKSRKIRKQQKEENSHGRRQLTRHKSHMTEQKPTTIMDTESENDSLDEQANVCEKLSSDDNDSHYSKENERWQHLFNSVLGQIRAPRLEKTPVPQDEEITPNRTSYFESWREQGEEKLKSEYYKQKSQEPIPSSNAATVRL